MSMHGILSKVLPFLSGLPQGSNHIPFIFNSHSSKVLLWFSDNDTQRYILLDPNNEWKCNDDKLNITSLVLLHCVKCLKYNYTKMNGQYKSECCLW